MKANNIFFKRFISRLAIVGAIAGASMITSSCAEDYMNVDEDRMLYEMNADGTFGPLDLTISIDAEANDSKTRGNFNTNDFEITSMWVCMFNYDNGTVVAMNKESYNDGNIVDGNHNNGTGLDAITFKNLMFSDGDSRVYIAGVANYENITAMDANGNEGPLIEVLDSIKNFVDFKNIAINTVSAEKALNGKNRPVVAGLWGNNHGNFTVDLKGKVHSNNAATAEAILYDSKTKRINQSHIDAIQNGKIHLRRPYSHLNVNIDVAMGGFLQFENPTIQVYNIPEYTFLQEHKTVTNSETYKTEDDWKAVTHTAADIYGERFTSDLISPGNPYSNENKAFIMNPEDAMVVTDNGTKRNIKFGYWHYETKNWGLPSLTSQKDREKRIGNSDFYASLCPSDDKTFNNNAPYMVLRADVETNSYKGKVEYIIHEGFCNLENGEQASSEATAVRDFCTFRNTNYTYNVQINGLGSMILKVSSEDMSGDVHHAVGGEFWSKTERKNVNVVKAGASYQLTVPAGDLYWCIVEDNGAPYGKNLDSSWEHAEKYPLYPTNVNENINTGSSFYQSIKLDGALLGDIQPSATERTFNVTFGQNETINGLLYICAKYVSADGTTIVYPVYCFNQNGAALDIPEVRMPYASTSGVILGVEDHTISWKAIAGAESYTIKLAESNGMGGYYVTLKPGETKSDAEFIGQANVDAGRAVNVTLTQQGDELFFRMRYANSVKSLLNFLQSQNEADVTFEVTANNSKASSPEPGKLAAKIINPVWNFNDMTWQNATLPSVVWSPSPEDSKIADYIPAGTNIKVNGLTVYSGSSNKLRYEKHTYYTFRPNGSGNKTSRGFKFHAITKGKLGFWTTSAGSSAQSGRYVVAEYQGGSSAITGTFEAATKTAGTFDKSSNGKSGEIKDINPNNKESLGVDNVWIYNSGDFCFYQIQFTPEDQ